MQIMVNVEPEWVKQKMGVIMNYDGGRAHQINCFYVGRQLRDHVSLKDAPGADDEGLA